MWSWKVKRERSSSPHAASLLPFSPSVTISVSHQAIPTRAALHGRHIAAADWSSRRRTRGTDCSAGNISSRGESEGVDSSGRRGSHRWRVRVAAGSAGGSRGSDGASRPLSAPVPPPVVPSPAAAAAAGRGQHAAGADRDDGSATPGRGAAAALNQAETASEPPPHGGSTTGAGREGAGANARAESRDCIADEAAEAGPEMRAEAEGGSSARFRETLQMVETAMLAATSGLAFFLANSLRVEGYLGFFFPLPAVVASMRWGATAGLRTAISAAFLLLVLAGPIKAITFLVSPTLLSCSSGISSASHLNLTMPPPLSRWKCPPSPLHCRVFSFVFSEFPFVFFCCSRLSHSLPPLPHSLSASGFHFSSPPLPSAFSLAHSTRCPSSHLIPPPLCHSLISCCTASLAPLSVSAGGEHFHLWTPSVPHALSPFPHSLRSRRFLLFPLKSLLFPLMCCHFTTSTREGCSLSPPVPV
ncbi:unnamed protein product [Closterium sp. NIES-54]